MAKQKSKKEFGPAQRKVWRIFHFESRYEMPEDMKSNRKSGLNYTKRFVGINGGDEAVGYQQQMGMMCNGDGQEACLLEGLYGKLVNMAAALSRAKRGYLIDADDKPLSSAQIAKLLNIKPSTMRKMIARFEAVKLLERIELPEFDLSKNEPPAQKDKKGGGKKKSSGDFPKNPEKSGKKGKPLKKEPKPKAFNITTNLEFEEKKQTVNRPGYEGDGKQTGTTHTPTTTPPVSSTSPDATGGIGSNSRRISPQALVKNCEPIGAIVDLLRFRYDADSLEFADEMLVRMGFITPYEMERIRSGNKQFSPEQANERAHWAKTWCDCKSQFDDNVMLQLRDKIFNRTANVRANKAGVRNPAAFLMTSWNNLVRDVMRKCKAM